MYAFVYLTFIHLQSISLSGYSVSECFDINNLLDRVHAQYNLSPIFLSYHHAIFDPNAYTPVMLRPFLIVRDIYSRLNRNAIPLLEWLSSRYC